MRTGSIDPLIRASGILDEGIYIDGSIHPLALNHDMRVAVVASFKKAFEEYKKAFKTRFGFAFDDPKFAVFRANVLGVDERHYMQMVTDPYEIGLMAELYRNQGRLGDAGVLEGDLSTLHTIMRGDENLDPTVLSGDAGLREVAAYLDDYSEWRDVPAGRWREFREEFLPLLGYGLEDGGGVLASGTLARRGLVSLFHDRTLLQALGTGDVDLPAFYRYLTDNRITPADGKACFDPAALVGHLADWTATTHPTSGNRADPSTRPDASSDGEVTN
jgi:hypothetical protein